MPELELDSGKDADKNMSGEEDIVDETQTTTTENDERFNDDGMEAVL